MTDMNEKAIEAAARAMNIARRKTNDWDVCCDIFKDAFRAEARACLEAALPHLSALPPLRAREEIARTLENAALFLEIGARYAPNEVVDQRIIATKERLKLRGLADVMRAVAEDCHALSRTAGQEAADYTFTSSQLADYVQKCREAWEAQRTAGQEWRDISSAPKEPMDGHAYGPTILLWVDGTVGVACWDYDFRKFYIEYPEGGSQPTHWMPFPAPPVAEPIVAEKSEVKS